GTEYPAHVYLISPNNSPTTFNIQTPIAGVYLFYVRLINGSILINGSMISNHTVEFQANINGSYQLQVKALDTSAEVSVFAILPKLHPSIILTDPREVNPVTYTAHYSSNVTSLLILAQPYSNEWRLTLSGKTYLPIPLYLGNATGFIIPPATGQVTITYMLQLPLNIGLTITTISLLALTVYLVYKAIRRRI
ncbi:MAG: hypothetical protein QW429_06600, partial [Thermoprotei archaeon]